MTMFTYTRTKPIILAIGDSFTDPNFESHLQDIPDDKRGGWDMWPDYIKQNIERHTGEKHMLVNTGRSGAGNNYLFKNMAAAFAKYGDRIKYVFWGSTEWQRHEEFWTGSFLNIGADIHWYEKFLSTDDKELLRARHCDEEIIKLTGWYYKEKFSKPEAQRRLIISGAQHMYQAHHMARSHGAQYLEYPLIKTLPSANSVKSTLARVFPDLDDIDARVSWDDKWRQVEWSKTPYADYLMEWKEHFPNNQFLVSDAQDWTTGRNLKSSKGDICKLRIRPVKPGDANNSGGTMPWLGGLDNHPNAAGQKDIAEHIWKYYIKTFADK